MTINTAKRRMLEGKPAIGIALGLGSTLAAEMVSAAGFDYVMVDNQHGAWDAESTMSAFRSICHGPAVPMARAEQNDFFAIGNLLDRGALGIVVPLVNSAEDAEAAARAVRYPPRGGRSWGPFGAEFHGPDYGSWIDDEVFLAVQIESAQAAECAEEILAVEGVDGCWIGPNDLARTMGVDLSTPEGAQAHKAAILGVLDACRKTNKIPGIYAGGDPEYWIEQGFLFVVVADDDGLLLGGARETLQKLRRFMD